MAQARRLGRQELETWKRFRLMARKLDAQLARELARTSELSMQDYDVLSSVAPLPDRRASIKWLTDHLELSFSRLSHHLDRMERRDLVRREPQPTGRGTDIVVTEKGLATIRGATDDHLDAVARSFADPLTAADIADLHRIADAVLKGLADEPR